MLHQEKLAVPLDEGVSTSDERYCELITNCAKRRRDQIVGNSHPSHHSFIQRTLIHLSRTRLSFLGTHLLPPDCASPSSVELVRDELLRARSRSVQIQLLLVPEPGGEVAEPLAYELAGRGFDVRTVEADRSTEISRYFMVADSSAYRCETRDDSPASCGAIANFGDTEMGEVLQSFFDASFETSPSLATAQTAEP